MFTKVRIMFFEDINKFSAKRQLLMFRIFVVPVFTVRRRNLPFFSRNFDTHQMTRCQNREASVFVDFMRFTPATDVITTQIVDSSTELYLSRTYSMEFEWPEGGGGVN